MKPFPRRAALAFGFLGLLTLFAAPGGAVERSDFTQAKFDAAAQAGKPILVEVWAAWCPVCRAQDPIIKSMMADPAFANLVILSVDFDKEKPLLRTLNVAMQSTLIAFKGTAEVGRSTGDTSNDGVRALARKAL